MDLFGKKAEKENKNLTQQLNSANEQSEKYRLASLENERLFQEAQKKLDNLGYTEYAKVMEAVDKGNEEITQNNSVIAGLRQRIEELNASEEKLSKQVKTSSNKLNRSKELYKSIEYSISNFFDSDPCFDKCKLPASESAEYDELTPSVILKLHAMDLKDLRKAFRDNDKQIETILSQYASRYTTKANQAIYKLMVISLRAELQNILYGLKYEKLDDAVEQVKNMTAKYLSIAAEGNQSIAGTITKFIGEIEYLFINAVKIEYNYYVKKEQARQEQLAIREQIRQEAEERKALEIERKKIEAEESKYLKEIENIQAQFDAAGESEKDSLGLRLHELQDMLSGVILKKEDIVNLQNGKAGNIYVISNLGSFGENVFKVGMTRRLDPQERINELSNASVPFKFDVHSFIFSEDAVGLESKLHGELNDKRVNKVNLRKEFFYSTVDDLEELVLRIDPNAEFNRTMLAEDFRQSISSDEIYTSDFIPETDEDE